MVDKIFIILILSILLSGCATFNAHPDLDCYNTCRYGIMYSTDMDQAKYCKC